jgi:DNA-binding LacI/PurR family transcriptional regulator
MLKERLTKYIEKQKREGREKLPPDRKLCEIFKVSRPTIMKELAQLVGEGAIVRKKGSGTFIAEKDPAKTSRTIGTGFRNALYNSNNDFFIKIINHLSQNCQKLNIELQLFDRLKDIFKRNESDNGLIKNIDSGIIDGFLLGSRMPMEIISAISSKIPTVSLNNTIDASEITCVCCDYFSVGFIVAEYLLEMGHKNIGFIAGDQNHPEVWKNISAIKNAYKMRNIPFNPENIAFIKGSSAEKIKKAAEFRKRKNFTAIFFINNIISESFHKLADFNLTPENNCSIIVSGDFGGCEKFGITAVDTKLEEVCRLGVKLLNDKLNGINIKNNCVILDPEIIERDSVRKI